MLATTISRVLPIVARELGLDVRYDRAELIRKIDECRAIMHTSLGKASREAFFTGKRETVVQTFKHDCRSRCNSEYLGFTLPPDVISAEVFRIGGERVDIKAEHSGNLNGCGMRRGNCLVGLDLGSGWPLPCDPPEVMELGFRLDTDNCTDTGLRVGVSYFDENGTLQREDVVLTGETHYTRYRVTSLNRHGITLPPGRTSLVEVYSGTDRVTDIPPSVDVPEYRRYQISSPVYSVKVCIEDAIWQPLPSYFDSDPVECGDSIFWKNLIQWEGLHFKTKRTPSEERAYSATTQILSSQAGQMLDMKEPDSIMPVIMPVISSQRSIKNYRNLRRRSTRIGRRGL